MADIKYKMVLDTQEANTKMKNIAAEFGKSVRNKVESAVQNIALNPFQKVQQEFTSTIANQLELVLSATLAPLRKLMGLGNARSVANEQTIQTLGIGMNSVSQSTAIGVRDVFQRQEEMRINAREKGTQFFAADAQAKGEQGASVNLLDTQTWTKAKDAAVDIASNNVPFYVQKIYEWMTAPK